MLARQRRQREEEEAQREAELQAATSALEAEIAAQLAGAKFARQIAAQAAVGIAGSARSRAGEEVETAKAATAAREEEAAAAWEKVLAARKEARAAEYEATRAAKTAEGKGDASRGSEEGRNQDGGGGSTSQSGRDRGQGESGDVAARRKLRGIGAEFVNVLTAGDDLVCLRNAKMPAKKGPIRLTEAQGLDPFASELPLRVCACIDESLCEQPRTGRGRRRMIEGFEVMMIWPGVYLVTAIMVDAPSVQLGIFGSVEDIDEACEQFIAEHRQQLH